jgi:hypothetical protein
MNTALLDEIIHIPLILGGVAARAGL